MVIFSTNKKNTGKKKGKNCLHEDDVGKNVVCGNVYVNMKAIFAVMNTTQAVVKEGLKKNSGLYGI